LGNQGGIHGSHDKLFGHTVHHFGAFFPAAPVKTFEIRAEYEKDGTLNNMFLVSGQPGDLFLVFYIPYTNEGVGLDKAGGRGVTGRGNQFFNDCIVDFPFLEISDGAMGFY
jgi:hypothetical protein